MNLVTRAQWGARPRRHIVKGNLSAKSTGHWNGPKVTIGGKTSWDHSRCAGLVRGIQNFHMDSRGWSDIAYNFVVCPHGVVFEGRGLNVVNGANGTNNGNRTSHAIMWLSGQGNPFTNGEKTGFRSCVNYVAGNTKAPDAAIGHRDHKSTECPGTDRYNWIHNGMSIDKDDTNPDDKVLFKFGDRGDGVEFLQNMLNVLSKYRIPSSGKGHGAHIPPSGYFGPMTREAVAEFQRFLVSMWKLSGKKGASPAVNGIVTQSVSDQIGYWVPSALKN